MSVVNDRIEDRKFQALSEYRRNASMSPGSVAEPWEVLDYIRERIGWTQSYRYYGIAQIKDEVRVGDELDAADVLIFADDELACVYGYAEGTRQDTNKYLAVVGTNEEPTGSRAVGPLKKTFGKSRVIAVVEFRD